MKRKQLKFYGVFLGALLLASCGGSGGSSSPADPESDISSKFSAFKGTWKTPCWAGSRDINGDPSDYRRHVFVYDGENKIDIGETGYTDSACTIKNGKRRSTGLIITKVGDSITTTGGFEALPVDFKVDSFSLTGESTVNPLLIGTMFYLIIYNSGNIIYSPSDSDSDSGTSVSTRPNTLDTSAEATYTKVP